MTGSDRNSRGKESPGTTSHPKTTGPGVEDSTPASPQAGSHATAAQAIASHAALPTIPSTVCPPIGLTNLVTDVSPFGTSRIALRSSQQTV